MKKDARAAARLPYWQTEPCPPWCWMRHRDEDTLTDRIHLSDLVGRVRLSLHDQVRFWGREFGPFSTLVDPEFNLFVMRGPREVEPRIQLGYGESRVTFDLTPAEAVALAQELTKAADLAEGQWGG